MLKKFLTLFFLRGVKILLSVASMLVLARTVGVSDSMDIWILAFSIVTGAGMIMWGPVNEILRSKYIRLKNHTGDDEVYEYVISLINVTILLNCLVVFLFFIYYIADVDIFMAAQQPQYKAKLLLIILVMTPSLILSQYASVSACLVNCHEILYVPELIGILGGFFNILIVYYFYEKYGIYSLVAGYYVSLLISILYGLKFYWKYGFLRQKRILNFNFKHFAYFYKGAPILAIAYFAGQFNGLYEKTVAANMGVGYVSLVNYASQIKGTLQAVFASVIITIIVPTLSKINYREHGQSFYRNFSQGHSIVLLFLLILIPIITSSSASLTVLIFSEKIGLDTQFNIFSNLLVLYTACLFPIGLYLIFGFGLISQGKEKVYAVISIAAQVISIFITYGFSSYVKFAIFPISLFISHTIAALFMLYFMEISSKKIIVQKFIVYGSATLLISLGIVLVKHMFLLIYPSPPVVDVAISLLLGLVVGFLSTFFDSEMRVSFFSRLGSKFV
jgi:putative peptidoglycan lipid II flippase